MGTYDNDPRVEPWKGGDVFTVFGPDSEWSVSECWDGWAAFDVDGEVVPTVEGKGSADDAIFSLIGVPR